MTLKRCIANAIKQITLLRWGLSMAVMVLGPRNYVGAMGAIFNDAGQVLLVEHVFRPQYPWGLPGGWVERGEHPARSVQRELVEELNLRVQVKALLFCEPQGIEPESNTPPGLALAYYGRLVGGRSLTQIDTAHHAFEVLSAAWFDPDQISFDLVPLQRKAIVLGQRAFAREQAHATGAEVERI